MGQEQEKSAKNVISEDVRKELLALAEQMPAFPIPVQRIISLTSSPGCSPRELVAVIEHDPVLTGRIMKVVNSAYFSLPRIITSVRHATVFVGINTVRNLALSIAAIGTLKQDHSANLNPKIFLMHALLTGAISRQLALSMGVRPEPAEDYFLAGILHDVGQICLSMHHPKAYRALLKDARTQGADLCELERDAFGYDHTDVGAAVINHWSLPETVAKAVQDHHNTHTEEPHSLLSDCTFVANEIANQFVLSENLEAEDKSEVLVNVSSSLPPAILERIEDSINALQSRPVVLNQAVARVRIFTEL